MMPAQRDFDTGSGVDTIPVVGIVVPGSGGATTLGSGGTGLPVTVADGADVVAGAVADAAVSTDASGTLSAKLRGLIVLITAMSAKLPASLGIKTAAASLSVTHASDDAVKAAVEIMDDWDETNRAAVNTIAGQVGVQGASGVVTALTQRVVLATDVALPAGTNAIGKLSANSGVDIGDVDVTSAVQPAGGTLTAGSKELTTTAAAALGAQACKSVLVKNPSTNLVAVNVGDSVARTVELLPGEAITLAVSNVSQVYGANASSTTQTVGWLSIA